MNILYGILLKLLFLLRKIETVLINLLNKYYSYELPLSGYKKNNVDSGEIEYFNEDNLIRLNKILPWQCYTADIKGRRFGDREKPGKRDKPQIIPDRRIVELDRLFTLNNKSILEFGCFEGIHTIAMESMGARVYAVDSRIENVVKTIVRSHLFGYSPRVTLCNLENDEEFYRLPKVDILHHVGVLYHLIDPVKHLMNLKSIVRDGMLLDTHYSTPEMLNGEYQYNGKTYRYYNYREGGREEVFSGMYDHAKWLLIDDITSIFSDMGYSDIRIINQDQQRNGPRFTAYIARPGVMKN